jgi:hypothetical protein
MNSHDHENEDYYLLGTGTWLDWLPNLPKPLIAFGRKHLYSVLLNGQDFSLPIGGSKDPLIGFYTTRFVAAENLREAEKAAHGRVIREWKRKGYLKLCGKNPTLYTEEVIILNDHFRFRAATGFAFYDNEDSD